MKSINIRKNSPNYGSKIAFWLFLSIVFTACTAPKSVRIGNAYQAKPKKEMAANSLTSPRKDTTQAQESIISKINETNPEPKAEALNTSNLTEPKRRLPTLREQMTALEEKQKKTEDEVNAVNNKVEEHDKNIAEIKSNIENLKTALAQAKNEKAQTGNNISMSSNTNKSGSKDIKPQSAIILSDEEAEAQNSQEDIEANKLVEKPKQIVKNVSKPKKQISAKPVKKQAPITIKKNAPKKEQASKEIAEKAQETKKTTKNDLKKNTDDKNDTHFTSDDLSSAIGEIQNKNYGSALTGLQKAESKAKDVVAQSEISYYYGEAYSGMKNYQKAAPYYQKVAKMKNAPKQAKAQAKLAEVLYKAGQTAEAKTAYEKLLEKYPKSEFAPVAKKMLQQL